MILRGQRPGDQRFRVERVKPRDYAVEAPRRIRRPPSPALVLLVGFAVLIAAGTVLLALPFSSADGRWTSPIDALFTATSAVCVTGLVVHDTGTYWSGFGQSVIIVLVQAGGFGFMTGSTLLLALLVRRRTALSNRLVVQASTGALDLGSVTTIARRAAVFTLVAEAVGAVILVGAFLARGAGLDTAIAWGAFHSISAFNNAGFDLMGGFRSLSVFSGEWLILATVGALIVLGGLGVAIVDDLFTKRRWSRTALETKVVVLTTVALIAVGASVIAMVEWSNPATLGAIPEAERPLNALFESITLRTAGFSSLPTGQLREATLLVVIGLMFIGGASGSAAGGIKVNTFGVLLIAIVSTMRGKPSAEAFGRRIPHSVIDRALAIAFLSILFAFALAFALQITSGLPFLPVLFESVSAFGTVGASAGITPDLPDASRLLLALAMFAGRLGPLTLVLALSARLQPVRHRPAVEALRIG